LCKAYTGTDAAVRPKDSHLSPCLVWLAPFIVWDRSLEKGGRTVDLHRDKERTA
jgi:hypothetical protein